MYNTIKIQKSSTRLFREYHLHMKIKIQHIVFSCQHIFYFFFCTKIIYINERLIMQYIVYISWQFVNR